MKKQISQRAKKIFQNKTQMMRQKSVSNSKINNSMMDQRVMTTSKISRISSKGESPINGKQAKIYY